MEEVAAETIARPPLPGLLVVADAAVQIAHSRDEAVLGNRLWVAWSWKHVAGDFSNLTFWLLRCSEDFLTARLAVLAEAAVAARHTKPDCGVPSPAVKADETPVK